MNADTVKSIKAPKLCRGDLLGLIAPASTPSADEKIEKGVHYLEHLGYRVIVGKHVSDEYGYLAGTDEHRADDVNMMIRNNEVKGIFCIRGGYGTPRIVSMIDYRSLKRHPKIFVGYSDITALQLAIFKKTGLITFSGPMTGTDMWSDFDARSEEYFWRMLTSTNRIGELKNSKEEPIRVLRGGQSSGRILGGNLSLLTSTLGTPFLPKLKDCILLIEEIGEEPYRIDRMLAQLKNAGIFRQLSGLVLGNFTDCETDDPDEPHFSVTQVLEQYVAHISCPVISRFQYGHIPRKLTIPLGLMASLNSKSGSLTFAESAVV